MKKFLGLETFTDNNISKSSKQKILQKMLGTVSSVIQILETFIITLTDELIGNKFSFYYHRIAWLKSMHVEKYNSLSWLENWILCEVERPNCQALVTRSIVLCWDLVLNSVSKVLTILLFRIIFSFWTINRFIFGFGSE